MLDYSIKIVDTKIIEVSIIANFKFCITGQEAWYQSSLGFAWTKAVKDAQGVIVVTMQG
jgi:hypothetical protein